MANQFNNPGANLTSRNRLAQMLMQQEQAAPPIQSHSQGLASMLRQGLAGYMQGADVRDQMAAQEAATRGMSAQPWVNPDTGQTSTAQAGGYEGGIAALGGLPGNNEYGRNLAAQLQFGKLDRDQAMRMAEANAQRDYELGVLGAREKSQIELKQMADPRYQESIRQRAQAQAEAYGMRPMTPMQEAQMGEIQRKAAAAQADRASQGEAALFDIDRTVRSANELVSHPGRSWATGASSWTSAIPGTDAKGFSAKLETLQSQVFLPEVQKMVGMGALSNAEGQKLASAFASLDPSMPEDEFVGVLNQAITDMQAARSRMEKKFGGYGDNQPMQQNTGADGGITEDDIQETMRANGMTREQVMQALRGQ